MCEISRRIVVHITSQTEIRNANNTISSYLMTQSKLVFITCHDKKTPFKFQPYSKNIPFSFKFSNLPFLRRANLIEFGLICFLVAQLKLFFNYLILTNAHFIISDDYKKIRTWDARLNVIELWHWDWSWHVKQRLFQYFTSICYTRIKDIAPV